MKNNQKFKIGDKVKVNRGKYKGVFGTIKDIANFRLYDRLTYYVKLNDKRNTEEVFVSYELDKMDMTGKEKIIKQDNPIKCIVEFNCNPLDRFGTMPIKDIKNLATKITINDKVITNRHGNSGGIEKQLILPLEEAQKMYKAGGYLKEFVLKVFTEEELNPVPRTWLEYYNNYVIPACQHNEVFSSVNNGTNDNTAHRSTTLLDITLPDKDLSINLLALSKLLLLRNAWVKDWTPDWSDEKQEKYYLKWCFKNVSVFPHSYTDSANEPLSFPTIQMARSFKDYFNDLLTKAKDLY